MNPLTTMETKALADQMAELLNSMTKDQWDLFQAGMLQSDSEDFSQQQIMDGFAALIHGGFEVRWQWDVGPEAAAEEAARERDRQIARGQIEMFTTQEGVQNAHQ